MHMYMHMHMYMCMHMHMYSALLFGLAACGSQTTASPRTKSMTVRSPLTTDDSLEADYRPLQPQGAQAVIAELRSVRALNLRERMGKNPYVQPSVEDYAARMKSYQALDFDLKTSDVHVLEQMRKTKATLLYEDVLDLLAYVLIGVGTALVAFCIFAAVQHLDELKHGLALDWLREGNVAAAFCWWLGVSLAYGLASSLLVVFLSPEAAGSGVPEVKAYLNGTRVPRFLRPACALVKAVGVCFSVAAGLVIGKEGPLIHIGGALGSLLSHELAPASASTSGGPRSCRRRFPRVIVRPDRQRRDFVSAGAAAGVAAAFSSPLGGMCFAFEEAASYWQVNLTWRVLLSSIVTVSVLWTVEALRQGRSSFFGLLKFGSFSDAPLFEIWELPLLAVLGVVGGLLGALFCSLNARLSIWRISHVAPHKWRCVAEVLVVVAVTAAVAFWVPFAFVDRCRPAVPNYQCAHSCAIPGDPDAAKVACGQFSSNCTDVAHYVDLPCAGGAGGYLNSSEFNTYATLTWQRTEGDAILAFFHSPGRFDKAALLVFAVLTFILAVVAYGIQVPSGLFVPCIVMGCSWGRLWGEILRDWMGPQIMPGTYALVGAASMLAGVTRLTITLAVILYETTNQVTLGIPTMIAILVAKVVADQFNISLYDIHIALKALPFIEPEPPLAIHGMSAREVMNEPCVTIRSVGPALQVVEELRDCKHSAFPLTDSNGKYCGMVMRDWLVLLLERQAHVALQCPSATDCPTSTPPTSATSTASAASATSTASAASAASTVPAAPAASSNSAAFATSSETHALCLEKDGEHSGGLVLPEDFRWQRMHSSHIEAGSLQLSDEASEAISPRAILDLRPYMDTGAVTVSETSPATQCFELFRRHGLRHLPVHNTENEPVGMITRQELTTDFHVASLLRSTITSFTQ